MNEQNYQILALIFAVLFFGTLVFWTIPNYGATEYDRFCRGQGLDYADVDIIFGEFECCKIYEVSDWENQITYQVEGCSESFDFEVVE